MRELLAEDFGGLFSRAAQRYAQDGLSASSVVRPLLRNSSSVVAALFAGPSSSIASRFRNVALLVEGPTQIGLARQVFFVNQRQYDTHGDQLNTQGRPSGSCRRRSPHSRTRWRLSDCPAA
ncbi:MAG: hypothetical protein U1F58_12385 [Burkholderiales bacterium]